jgi:hypothetical protein
MVRCRIPERIIDAVQNSNEAAGSLPQDTFESIAKLRAILNLLCIRGAHRRNQVRIRDPDLHEIHEPVKLKRTRRVEFGIVEARAGHDFSWEQTLVTHIVNREHRAGLGICVIGTIKLLQIRRDQPGLVIVTVENVRSRRGELEKLHDRALKENPSVSLIRVVLSGSRVDVDSRPIKEAVVAKEDNVDRGIRKLSAVNFVRDAFVSDRDFSMARGWNRFETEFLQVDDPVPRNNDGDLDAEFMQS